MSAPLVTVASVRPWLTVNLPGLWRAISFAPYRSGDVACDQIVWREVRDEDLSREFDAIGWLANEVTDEHAVAMLTSRNVERFVHHRAVVDDVVVEAVVTVGLSNAERVGTRRALATGGFGTINVGVAVSSGLTMAARIEALSIAASARTTVVLEAGLQVETGVATGTGTDCIVVASPDGVIGFAGLHTSVGEAVGACVYNAVSEGVSQWLAER